jgi:hypothetical protein
VPAFGQSHRVDNTNTTQPKVTHFDYCRDGTVKGGGYDATTELYAWTCGNFAWSAHHGGHSVNAAGDIVAAPNSATTPGGNSWTLECTGTQTAEGGHSKQTICYADGESIKMYAGADMILAFDNVEPGGTVYLPEGIYHDAFCGAQEDGTANNCPLLRSPYDTFFARRISWNQNKKWIGEGSDNLWDRTEARTRGTWWLHDHGTDDVADSDIDAAGTGLGSSGNTLYATLDSAYEAADFWPIRMGTNDDRANICVRDITDSTGCQPTSGTLTDNHAEAAWGRIGQFLGTQTFSASEATSTVCIDNTITDMGTCSGDRRIICSTNTGNRLTGTTGSCQFDFDGDGSFGETGEDLGTCEGLVDAIATDIAASEELYAIFETGDQESYSDDLSSMGGNHSQSYLTRLQVVDGTACETVGKEVEFTRVDDQTNDHLWPVEHLTLDAAAGGSTNFKVTTKANTYNMGAEWAHMTLMPAHPVGGTTCATAASDIECDEGVLIALGAGLGGTVHNIATYFAGGDGDAPSLVDGSTASWFATVRDSYFGFGRGLGSDGSGWIWEDNTWEDWDTQATGLLAANFSSGAKYYRQNFRRIAGSHLFTCQGASGGIFRDFHLEQSDFGTAIIRTNACHNATFDSWFISGTSSPSVVTMDSENHTNVNETWGNTFRNFVVQGWTVPNSNRPAAAITLTDYDSAAQWDGRFTKFSFRDWRVQTLSDNSIGANTCLIFLDGLTGDDSDSDNGGSRTVDEDRRHLLFDNLDMELIGSSGTHKIFCLGDSNNNINEADTAGMLDWKSMTGEMPVWRNLSLDGVPIPDQPYPSQTAAGAGDCGGYPDGIVVRIHDDTAVGACTDAGADGILDGGGSSSSVCVCDPAGDSADGAWAAF